MYVWAAVFAAVPNQIYYFWGPSSQAGCRREFVTTCGPATAQDEWAGVVLRVLRGQPGGLFQLPGLRHAAVQRVRGQGPGVPAAVDHIALWFPEGWYVGVVHKVQSPRYKNRYLVFMSDEEWVRVPCNESEYGELNWLYVLGSDLKVPTKHA